MTTDEATARTLSGACLCGAVRYRVTDAFRYAMNCHCSKCRRTTGSAFKPIAGIEREHLSVEQGADRILVYGDPDASHDLHCGTCGSFLFSIVRDGAWAHVGMGSLVDEPTIRPTIHICVASKAGWDQITDDLPQFPGLPDI